MFLVCKILMLTCSLVMKLMVLVDVNEDDELEKMGIAKFFE